MSYRINELATLTGVSIRTLRYYDKIGLLVPERQPNEHRYYSQKNYFELMIILELKELGLALAEIAELLKQRSTDFKALLLLRKEVLQASINQQRKQLAQVEELLTMEIDSLADFETITFEQAIFKHNPYRKEAKEIWQQRLSQQLIIDYATASETTSNDFETYYSKLAPLQHLPISDDQVQLEISRYVAFLQALYQESIDEEGLLVMAASYQTNQAAVAYLTKYGSQFPAFLSQGMSYYLEI